MGGWGEFSFPRGYYVYVGSALGGIVWRLKCHLRGVRRPHWHVDYLRPYCRLVDIWYSFSSQRRECAWAEAVAGLPGVEMIVPRFGASDCRCPSHLFYFSVIPLFQAFREALSQRDVVERLGGSLAEELSYGFSLKTRLKKSATLSAASPS